MINFKINAVEAEELREVVTYLIAHAYKAGQADHTSVPFLKSLETKLIEHEGNTLVTSEGEAACIGAITLLVRQQEAQNGTVH